MNKCAQQRRNSLEASAHQSTSENDKEHITHKHGTESTSTHFIASINQMPNRLALANETDTHVGLELRPSAFAAQGQLKESQDIAFELRAVLNANKPDSVRFFWSDKNGVAMGSAASVIDKL